MGEKNKRHKMIDALEKKIQQRYGSNWKYTPRQREILRTLDKSFSVLNCVAGSGKTTLLVSLALWMLADKAKGGKGSLHYMTETQEMVNEFVNLVREVHGDNAGIAVIGYDREAGIDRLDAHLRERLEQKKIPLAKTIGKLSDALDFLRAQASTMFTESSTKNPDVDAEDEVDVVEKLLSYTLSERYSSEPQVGQSKGSKRARRRLTRYWRNPM